MKIRYATGLAPALIVLLSFGTIAAEDAPQETGLLMNSDFEAPPGATGSKPNEWIYFTSKEDSLRINTSDSQSGSQCISLTAQGINDAFQGLNQTISVEEKQRYSFFAHVKNDRANPLKGNLEGKLVIEWLDRQGKEIHRDESTPWNRNLTKTRWDDVSLKNKRAPSGAVRARFGVLLVESSGGKGSFLVDNLQLSK